MMYLDEGYYLSKSQSIQTIASLGMNPYTFIDTALTITLVTKEIKWVSRTFCGPGGFLVIFVARAYGAMNNGVIFDINIKQSKDPLGVNYSISY